MVVLPAYGACSRAFGGAARTGPRGTGPGPGSRPPSKDRRGVGGGHRGGTVVVEHTRRRTWARHPSGGAVPAGARPGGDAAPGRAGQGAGVRAGGPGEGGRIPNRNRVARLRRTPASYTTRITASEPVTMTAYSTAIGARHPVTP